MRTNIVLDDDIVNKAFSISGIKTKRELVNQALKEFVEHRKRLDLRDIKSIGELRADYDYKALRAGKIADSDNS